MNGRTLSTMPDGAVIENPTLRRESVKATDRLVFDSAMLVLKHAVMFPSV